MGCKKISIYFFFCASVLSLISANTIASTTKWYKPNLGGGWHSSLANACQAHVARQNETHTGGNTYYCTDYHPAINKYEIVGYKPNGEWAVTLEYVAGALQCNFGQKPDFLTDTCVAGQQNGGQSCPSTGNPINPFVGNKFETRHDLVSANEKSLSFSRYYNSKYPVTSNYLRDFGSYWRHTYSLSFQVIEETAFVWAELITGDGKSVMFDGSSLSQWNPHSEYDIEAVVDGAEVVGWEVSKGNQIMFFAPDSKLISIQNRQSGELLTLSYNSDGGLTEIQSSEGPWLTFVLNPDTQLISGVSSSTGETIAYAYDSELRLISATFDDNSQELYHYESPNGDNLLTGITDRSGHRYVEWSYDGETRSVLSRYFASSNNIVESYTLDYSYLEDTTDPRVIETNPFGKQTIYHWELVNGVRRLEYVEGVASANCVAANKSYTYYPNGKIQTKTDWKGNITSYQYDALGRETLRIEAVGSTEEKEIATEWHASLRVPIKITEGNRVTEMTYDSNGRLLSRRVGEVLPSATDNVITYTYTTEGKVETVDGPRTDIIDVTTYAYDTNGNLLSVQNALGQTTFYQNYDAEGRPTIVADVNGAANKLEYNSRGNLVSSILVHPANPTKNLETTYAYDVLGQLTRTDFPDGTWTEYEYDGARRLIAISNNNGDRIEYVLDAAGNKLSENIRDNGGTIRYSTQQAYDELSRLISIIGNNSQHVQLEYDVNDNLLSSTNARNATTNQAVDALDRLVSQLDANIDPITYEYDENDNLASVSDVHGINTEYYYDVHGNVSRITSRDTGITDYTYDAAGNRTSMLDAKGVVVEYSYDALNRLTAITYPSSSGENVTYSYDDTDGGNFGEGKLTAIEDASGTIRFEYDFAGRLIRKSYDIQGQVFGLQYVYSDTGQLTEIRYPSGREVVYGYNNLGQVESISTRANTNAALETVVNNITYLPFGPVQSWQYGNGVSYTQSYDLDYRPDARTVQGAQVLENVLYAYDNADNISGIADLVNSTVSQAFGYDLTNRLTSADGVYGEIDYAYDGIGNRLQRDITQQSQTTVENYQYDTQTRQLQGVSVGGQNIRDFAYDDNGNITADTAITPSLSFAYNAANRLSSVSVNSQTIQYLYNSLGQRTLKQGPTISEYFHYDEAGQLISVSNSNGIMQEEIIWLHNAPVAVLVNEDDPAEIPQLTISSPSHNATFSAEAAIQLTGAASDSSGDISANIVWESSIEGQLGSGASVQVGSLSYGTHIISASIYDGQTLLRKVSRYITVLESELPTISIDEPSTSSSIGLASAQITLVATAQSDMYGDMGQWISWSSDVDGVLGSGAEISTQLSAGQHVITATVTGPNGHNAQAYVNYLIVDSSDSDGDSLPDDWEYLAFGHLDQLATDDFDGDGANNLQEYNFGTEPDKSEPYRMAVLADGPLAYWRLNEVSGSVANDSGLNSNQATYVGSPSLNMQGALAGENDASAGFNQSNTYVNAGNLLGSPTELTFEAWAYLTGSGLNSIVTHRHASNNLVQLKFQTPSEIRFQLRSSTSTLVTLSHTASDFRNQWLHVVATLNVANNSQTLYVNGQLVDSDSVQFGGNFSANKLLVGAYDAGSGIDGYFGGRLDEVAIYTRQLSATEIMDHYEAGTALIDSDQDGMPDYWEIEYNLNPANASDAAGDPDNDSLTNLVEFQRGSNPLQNEAYKNAVLDSSPIAYWQLNETTGATTAIDSSGNGNNGTYLGGPGMGATGPVMDPGNTAADFNGSTNYLDAGNLLGDPQQVSYEIWANLRDTGRGMLMQHRSSTTNLLQLYFYSESEIRMALRSSGTPIVTLNHQAGDFRNQWLHLVAVFDNVNNRHALYVDGVEVAVDTTHLQGSFSATRFLIGDYYNTGVDYQFGGMLDEVSVYDRPLTAQEVQTHFQAGMGQ